MKEYKIYKLETATGVDYRVVDGLRDRSIRSGSICVRIVRAADKKQAVATLKAKLDKAIRS